MTRVVVVVVVDDDDDDGDGSDFLTVLEDGQYWRRIDWRCFR
jgi:hypothetical protein